MCLLAVSVTYNLCCNQLVIVKHCHSLRCKDCFWQKLISQLIYLQAGYSSNTRLIWRFPHIPSPSVRRASLLHFLYPSPGNKRSFCSFLLYSSGLETFLCIHNSNYRVRNIYVHVGTAERVPNAAWKIFWSPSRSCQRLNFIFLGVHILLSRAQTDD